MNREDSILNDDDLGVVDPVHFQQDLGNPFNGSSSEGPSTTQLRAHKFKLTTEEKIQLYKLLYSRKPWSFPHKQKTFAWDNVAKEFVSFHSRLVGYDGKKLKQHVDRELQPTNIGLNDATSSSGSAPANDPKAAELKGLMMAVFELMSVHEKIRKDEKEEKELLAATKAQKDKALESLAMSRQQEQSVTTPVSDISPLTAEETEQHNSQPRKKLKLLALHDMVDKLVEAASTPIILQTSQEDKEMKLQMIQLQKEFLDQQKQQLTILQQLLQQSL